MKKDLVISYYNSLDFKDLLKEIDNDFNTFIYNKSGVELKDLSKNHNQIMIENIGREGHTYLTHIINNYDNLSDITIFIQDDFYNHLFRISYFMDKLNENINKPFYQYPCSWRVGDGYSTISRTIINGFLDLSSWQPDNFAIKHFSERFGLNLPDYYVSETCAHFFVSKEKILKHSKEKYKEMLNWLLSFDGNGYTLEHAWTIIFM
jgi:hypothetical protein